MRTKAFAVVVAATGAIVLGAALAGGATPSPYEQVQSARKHLAAAKAEVANADTDLTAAEVALKPKEEPPPAGKEQTAWVPASTTQKPLEDQVAAACVTHKPEVHADNTPFNNNVPTSAEITAARNGDSSGFKVLTKYVSGTPGLSNPSTDDLIQWEACKWGIPTDWLRAEFVDESNWHQLECAGSVACTNGGPAGAGLEGRGFGDFATSNFLSTPTAAVQKGGAFTSIGITQIKSRPSSDPHPGTEPLRWKSTAWNLDYQGAVVRYYFNGLCSWCGTGYSAGQQWPSIGAWFNPSPWNNSGAISYQERVKGFLAARTWTGY